MRSFASKIFLVCAVAAVCFAADHQSLNGTWKLIPNRTDSASGPIVQTGTVTITDRQHHIYISRNFTYEGTNETVSTNFATDGNENSSIRQGKTFKTKAKWEGRVLKVVTTGENVAETESFSMERDGTLMLLVDRPGHPTLTLYFQQ
jgi:hypothetical protein